MLFSREHVFWLAIPYWVLFFGVLMGPFTLMLHNISHRPFLKGEYRQVQSVLINWILGPLFGHTPNSYFAHHIGMHHLEGNLEGDLSSTMSYERDGVLEFLRYFGKFLLSSALELAHYHWSRRRKKMFWSLVLGEVAYFAVAVFFTWQHWQSAVVVFWVPLLILRFGMMAGNWAQHAFVDINQPDNIYRNSITVINAKYNQNCFNDGYHIGHHLKSDRHWTEMPADFLANRAVYADQDAVVFRRIDYFVIWLFLMLRRFDWLAHFFVDLREQKRTKEEVVTFLRTRVQKAVTVPVEVAAAI